MKDKKKKIERSVAIQDFDRWCEDWEIDNETVNMNEDEKADFEGQKSKIVNAIMRGRMAFDIDSFKYTISEKSEKYAGQEVTISRPKGAGLMEMDKYKDRQGVHKTYAVLATMTKKQSQFFAGLDGIDVKPFLAVVTLFLAG